VGERQVQHPIAKKNKNNVYMYECSTNKKEMMMKKREKRKSLVLNKHCSSVRRAMILKKTNKQNVSTTVRREFNCSPLFTINEREKRRRRRRRKR